MSCVRSGIKVELSCDMFGVEFGLSYVRSGVKFGLSCDRWSGIASMNEEGDTLANLRLMSPLSLHSTVRPIPAAISSSAMCRTGRLYTSPQLAKAVPA